MTSAGGHAAVTGESNPDGVHRGPLLLEPALAALADLADLANLADLADQLWACGLCYAGRPVRPD